MVFGIFGTTLLMIVSFLTGSLAAQADHDVYYQNGLKFGLLGKFEEAKVQFELAISVDSLYTPAIVNLEITRKVLNGKMNAQAAVHFFKGINYGNLGEMEDKITEMSRSIELYPDNALAYNERGIAYAKQQMYHEAIVDYDRAIVSDPTIESAYFNKALSCERIQKYDLAIQAYQDFIQHASSRYQDSIFFAEQRIKDLENM